MQLTLSNNERTFVSMTLALTVSDIDSFIRLLTELKHDPTQHLHVTSSDDAYLDIEVGVQPDDQASNGTILGLAIDPDDV